MHATCKGSTSKQKDKDCYVDMAGYAAIAGEINDTDTSISTTK